jgi:hypothetical protein
MRRPPELAVARRDDLLARTRRVSVLVAGAATAGSIGLATVLGLSIPGKAATTGTPAPPSPGPSQGTAPAAQHGTGTHTRPGTRTASGPHANHGKHANLAPPPQSPSSSSAPPVTSSGGS